MTATTIASVFDWSTVEGFGEAMQSLVPGNWDLSWAARVAKGCVVHESQCAFVAIENAVLQSELWISVTHPLFLTCAVLEVQGVELN